MMGRLLKKYSEAPAGVKKIISYSALALIVALIAVLMYQGKKHAPPPRKKEVKFEEVVPEIRLLQKSLYQETRLKTQRLSEELMKLRAELKKTQQQLKEQNRKSLSQAQQYQTKIMELERRIEELKKAEAEHRKAAPVKVPPPPAKTPAVYVGEKQKRKAPHQPQWIGGIMVEKAPEEKKQQKKKEKKKQEKISVYLPPSFVEADLLNGFAAFSSQKGEKEPVRALFRLRDLAVLPNEVKADLEGCFVIGEARGDLSDERAHVRLLRLSCIGRDGSSVIDSPVQGWVVDEDGKAGLRGIVVTKMGAFLTRYMLAGFLQGFGEAYSESQYYTTYSSSSGVVTLPSPGEATKAGLGKGIAKAGKGLADFYLELAKQTLPVIEVGAGKRVTIVFTKGQELTIKNVCLEGRDGCRKVKTDFLSAFAQSG